MAALDADGKKWPTPLFHQNISLQKVYVIYVSDGMEERDTSAPNYVRHYVVDKDLLRSGILLSNCYPMLPTIKV